MSAYQPLRRLSLFRGGLFANESLRAEHVRALGFHPVWAVLAEHVRRSGAQSVIEVGCGTGEFARLLRDLGIRNISDSTPMPRDWRRLGSFVRNIGSTSPTSS